MPDKILIVDDDIDTLRLLGMMLTRQGYETIQANTGQQAIEKVQNEQPDLILMDIMMPGTDGYEATRQLRNQDDIPIIMFSAKNQVEDKLLAFDLGADDYLTKPTQTRELLAHVRAVLSRARRTAPASKLKPRGCLIGVLAVKGGLGVTTLTLNLGIALREKTQREVIVADFRPGYGSLALDLGYLKAEGLTHLLRQAIADIQDRVIEGELVSHSSGIRLLLSSPQPIDARWSNAVSHFGIIARNLPYHADYVLLDLGAGLNQVSQDVLNLFDEVIVVVEPFPNTITQTKALIDNLGQIGVSQRCIRLVLFNRVSSSMQIPWKKVQEDLGDRIFAVITPAPELAYQAAVNKVPLIHQQPDSLTTQQFSKLAEKVSMELFKSE
jgi:DNA-binding response OmpR family regulator